MWCGNNTFYDRKQNSLLIKRQVTEKQHILRQTPQQFITPSKKSEGCDKTMSHRKTHLTTDELRNQTREFATLCLRKLRFTGWQHIRLNRVSNTNKIRHSCINWWAQTSITYMVLFQQINMTHTLGFTAIRGRNDIINWTNCSSAVYGP